MAFQDQQGFVALPVLDAEGSVPVVDRSEKTDLEKLFKALIIEVRAARLAVTDLVNAGSSVPIDYLEMATSQSDPEEELS